MNLRRAVESLSLQISLLFWLVFGIWAVLRWLGWQKTQAMFAPPPAFPEWDQKRRCGKVAAGGKTAQGYSSGNKPSGPAHFVNRRVEAP